MRPPPPTSEQTNSTNQRAELTAIVRALDLAPRDRAVTIITDSKYAIDCVTKWYMKWEKYGWKTLGGKKVVNDDVIKNIRDRISEREIMGSETEFEWIRGHMNHPGNTEADRLAVNGAREAQNGF